MKKLILLLFLLFSKLFGIGADEYNACCSSAGLSYAGQIGWADDDEDHDFGSTCTVVFGGETIVTEGYRKALISCTCGVDDVQKPTLDNNETIIYDGASDSAPTECYEPIDPIFSADYIESCVEKKLCWAVYRPPFVCSELGTNWEYNSAQTSDTCEDYVDGDNFDSSNFLSDSSHSPTCCLHSPEDPNDTTPTPTPTPDDNETNPTPTPSPTHNPDVDCSNYDPCVAPYIRNIDDCGCHINTPPPSPSPTDDSGDGSGTSTTDNILNGIQSDINSASASANAKADETNQKLSETNAILSAIKADSISQSETNHNDLRIIKDAVNSSSTKNHNDLGKIDETLGGIKEGTDALKELIESGNDADIDGSMEAVNNAIDSARSNYSSILDTLNGLATSYTNTAPTFTGNGNSSFSAVIYGKSIVLDFALVAELRQYFDILFILILALLNFRIYLWIFNLLVRIGA